VTLAATGELVRRAAAGGRGILAFNFVTVEHAEAIVAGAEAAGSPVILGLSQNAVAYHGGRARPVTAAALVLAEDAAVEVGLHLDHVEDMDLLRQAPGAGFTSGTSAASRARRQARTPPGSAPTRPRQAGTWPGPGWTPWPWPWAARTP
jgi:fructose-bisphosphate aldolase class II